MHKTVELIKEWVEFEEQHPKGTLEDFCRNFLSAKEKGKLTLVNRTSSPDCQLIYSLTRVINRLSKLWMYFTLDAMKPMGLSSFDEFVFLYTVDHLRSVRKKDLIYMHFLEISSGLLVIDRLIKKGFLEERTDEQDKRSKQVSLSRKGKTTLEKCDAALSKVAANLYGEMPEEELNVCVQYLSPIENSIAQKWNSIKKFTPVVERRDS